MEQRKQPDLIPLSEAAQRLGISRVTMSKRVRDGHFTVYANPQTNAKNSSMRQRSKRPHTRR